MALASADAVSVSSSSKEDEDEGGERDGSSKRAPVEEPISIVPGQNKLITSVYPNPTSNSLTIEYNWEGDEPINVEFFDLLGSKVMTITLVKGQGKAIANVGHLANGTYIYRTSRATDGGKIVILR